MSRSERDEWVSELLENEGRLSFARLLQRCATVTELRDLARKHGVSPRGYRVDRAPAERLLPLFVDPQRPELIEDVCDLLLARLRSDSDARQAGTPANTVPESMLRLRDQELASARQELERHQEQAARQRAKEADLTKRRDREIESAARLRSQLEEMRRRLAVRQQPGGADARAREQRIHELERDLDALSEAEAGLRRLLAVRAARLREQDTRIAELEALVPRGRRRRVKPPDEPPLADEFRIPHLTASFYKSLEGKERRNVERAIQAILLFCTEGFSYPGLEVKQIEGMDLWSLRASLKLRVYFRVRDDNDVEFLAIADREDQDTTLKRLKTR